MPLKNYTTSVPVEKSKEKKEFFREGFKSDTKKYR